MPEAISGRLLDDLSKCERSSRAVLLRRHRFTIAGTRERDAHYACITDLLDPRSNDGSSTLHGIAAGCGNPPYWHVAFLIKYSSIEDDRLEVPKNSPARIRSSQGNLSFRVFEARAAVLKLPLLDASRQIKILSLQQEATAGYLLERRVNDLGRSTLRWGPEKDLFKRAVKKSVSPSSWLIRCTVEAHSRVTQPRRTTAAPILA